MAERVLYEQWREDSRRNTVVAQDGELLHIEHVQDTRPIVESAKRLAANFDPHIQGRADVVHSDRDLSAARAARHHPRPGGVQELAEQPRRAIASL